MFYLINFIHFRNYVLVLNLMPATHFIKLGQEQQKTGKIVFCCKKNTYLECSTGKKGSQVIGDSIMIGYERRRSSKGSVHKQWWGEVHHFVNTWLDKGYNYLSSGSLKKTASNSLESGLYENVHYFSLNMSENRKWSEISTQAIHIDITQGKTVRPQNKHICLITTIHWLPTLL